MKTFDLRLAFARDQVMGFWARAEQLKAEAEDAAKSNDATVAVSSAALKVQSLMWSREAEKARCRVAAIMADLARKGTV